MVFNLATKSEECSYAVFTRKMTSSLLILSVSILVRLPCGVTHELTCPVCSSNCSASTNQSSQLQPQTLLQCSEQDSCPTGYYCRDGWCDCLPHLHHVLICHNHTNSASILNCYCMTRNKTTGVIQVGKCLYNCGSRANGLHNEESSLYSKLPETDLNMICKDMQRTGVLCGSCKDNYYPQAYSFSWDCVKCHNYKLNWFKYFLAAYLPLTLFCIAVVIFQVNLASSHYYHVVTYCQVMALPVASRIMLDFAIATSNSSFIFGTKLVLSLYGIWNLDFFRPFYSSLCLGIDVLPTVALDYVIALYPLLFMVLCYLLINLYDRNNKIIRFIWSPFERILYKFRRTWNIRTSVIDSFATFFLLSNIKFLSVSFDLLIPTTVYQFSQGQWNHTSALYYAADVEYFGRGHLPYAIMALAVQVILVLLPVVVLICYPLNCFRKILNLFPARWYILDIFMDAFQGCYKDGTELGTRDCRWFQSIYFVCRFLFFIVYGLTLSMVFFVAASVPMMLLVIMIVVVQPFKSSMAHHTWIQAMFSQFLALVCVTIAAANISNNYTRHYFTFTLLSGALILAPVIYTTCLCFYAVYKKRKSFWAVVKALKARRNGYSEVMGASDEISDIIRS